MGDRTRRRTEATCVEVVAAAREVIAAREGLKLALGSGASHESVELYTERYDEAIESLDGTLRSYSRSQLAQQGC